jgi:hypothetical protein
MLGLATRPSRLARPNSRHRTKLRLQNLFLSAATDPSTASITSRNTQPITNSSLRRPQNGTIASPLCRMRQLTPSQGKRKSASKPQGPKKVLHHSRAYYPSLSDSFYRRRSSQRPLIASSATTRSPCPYPSRRSLASATSSAKSAARPSRQTSITSLPR